MTGALSTTRARRTPPSARVWRRWRSRVFTPLGDGSVRRRASDVLRVVAAIGLVGVLVPAMRADLTIEIHVVDSIVPVPEGVQWVVSTLWFVGSFATMVALLLLAAASRRPRLMLETALAALGTWALCGLMGATIGTTGGRPPDPKLAGVDTSFPLARVAMAFAVAAVVLPYLSRTLHRVVYALLGIGLLAAMLDGAGVPVDILLSVVLGWGVAAVVHLALGTPAGLPTAADVVDVVGDVGAVIRDVTLAADQEWGVARYVGHDGDGRPVEVSLYGRDASDAQALAKAWRFAWYRDSGPSLSVSRSQQVEHEAYLTLLTAQAGVRTATVVVAGVSAETGDAVLVTNPPGGRVLADLAADQVDDAILDSLFSTVERLRQARIAHGSISGQTILVDDDGRVGLESFRRASSGAPQDRLDADRADALVAAALVVGVDRALAALGRQVPPAELVDILPLLQVAALDRRTRDALHQQKKLLNELREAGATAAGVDAPELAEIRRVSWSSLAMGIGALVGVILIVKQFSGVDDLWSTLASAQWGWVFVAFVLAQLTNVAQAESVLGSVSSPLPFGPTIGLELANAFTGLVAGTVGTTATIIRYFQRRGLAVSVAVSSGVLVSLANMATQAVLFVVAVLITRGAFTFSLNQSQGSGSSSSGSDTTWLLLLLVGGLALVGAVTLVPRFRRRAVDKLRPQVDAARTNLRELAGQPSKLVRLFGGAVVSQVLFALVLGASLHAYGASASLGELIVVNTLASLLGGIAPVPGGMGVIEGGLIAGFTALGIPNTIAVAATLTARLMTAYLPPIWGYPTLVWMRRRQYL